MDILESLRDWQNYELTKEYFPELVKDMAAAAREIERLRAEVDRRRSTLREAFMSLPPFYNADFEETRNVLRNALTQE